MLVNIKEPLRLRGERVWRTYVGGREIGYLHGESATVDNHFPEEWMYSITQARNTTRQDMEEGLCKLADNPQISLKELMEQYPQEILGREHAKKWGSSTGVLIKIIDSLERLTIQVHPDKKKAKQLFDSRFGKTECWHILRTRSDIETEACIYLGFKPGITRERWVKCFQQQNHEAMLTLLHKIPVKVGDTYLIHGGVPHAIGSGCTIIEIQEPTDYTIRVERVTPSGFEIDDDMCHQGLGFDTMFDCFSYDGLELSEVEERFCLKTRSIAGGVEENVQLVGYEDTTCFKIERIKIEQMHRLKGDGKFACLYILSGQGILSAGTKEYMLKENEQFFIPAYAEPFTIVSTSKNPVYLLMMRGPQ